ncbi:hypothetical protein [Paracoccus sp. SM22M-07]|uniref:hypothetical protein n=1 Tax=Paracoccus sp. SM22M-07 TaxID=1520813 RepID=UPI000A7CBFD0|nr:hypothetical protein [Paracoccus sp. SM22M-07]
MSKFARRLHDSRVTEETVDNNAWFRELLRLWRPAGTPSEKDGEGRVSSLRLAVRDGYLSFYGAGQQIAKVKCTERSFHEEVHRKYLEADQTQGRDYLRPAPPAADAAGAVLANRVAAAAPWHGREKLFVDEVIAANPDIFDLEVALSLPRPGAARPIAVRLDLAALEPHQDGWRIVLWEAKMANDGRAKSLTEPTTMAQHRGYSEWLQDEANAAALIAGTKEACRLLVRLRELAIHAGQTNMPPLGKGIVAAGSDSGTPLTLDRSVRYVIDARGDTRATFIGNGHDAKLRGLAGHVQVIGQGDLLTLDTL